MKLTALELANFKVFGESTRIPIRPITLIFGPNSSGKSSLLQSLLLLKQSISSESSAGNSLVFKGAFADLGSYTDVVHNHDTSKSVSIGLSLDFSDESVVLEEYSERSGLVVNSPEILFRTNFVSGSTARDGIVASIEAILGDEQLVFETPKVDTSNTLVEDNAQGLPKIFSAARMQISPALSIGQELYELRVAPLVKLALNRLDSKMNKLRTQLAAAPNDDLGTYPEGIKVKSGGIRFRAMTKADVEKGLKRHEKLSSILSSYTVETFRRDFAAALKSVRVGLRGCILDRSIFVDRNTDILYPSFEKHGTKSGFYIETFKELLAPEFINDDYMISPGDETYYTHTYSSITRNWLLELVLSASEVCRRFLQRLLYIGPMRQFPLRYYLPDSIVGESVGKTGEFSPILLFQRPHLLFMVNKWLSQLKINYELEVARLVAKSTDFEEGVFALRLKSTNQSISSNVVDVGFGVSQLLPVVIQCLLSHSATICIEQPEIHLHPALQAELGDLFIDVALGDHKNTLILETHSEHLILRILRRIRETTNGDLAEGLRPVGPEDVQIIYAEPTPNGTVLHDLPITADGDFEKKWPDGFFAERAKELFS